MNINVYQCRLFHTKFFCSVAVLLMALAWSAPACKPPAPLGSIHDAARDGDLQKVQRLLENSSDLGSSKDKYGYTPLHVAAKAGHKEVAEFLLAHGADVNAVDDMGRTPLHWAAASGRMDMVELLLANKADVNAKDNDHATPLRWAANHSDVAELLRQHGARD
jgi:ankyrin repeat protein